MGDNHAPEVNQGDTLEVPLDRDTSATFSLSANDLDGDPLTWLVSVQPGREQVSLGEGSTESEIEVEYVPDANAHGLDAITLEVNDGRGGRGYDRRQSGNSQ